MTSTLKQNKSNAIAFYEMAYNGNPQKAVELYVGAEYIQHNPLVADGKQAFTVGGDAKLQRWNLSDAKKVAEVTLGGEGFRIVRSDDFL